MTRTVRETTARSSDRAGGGARASSAVVHRRSPSSTVVERASERASDGRSFVDVWNRIGRRLRRRHEIDSGDITVRDDEGVEGGGVGSMTTSCARDRASVGGVGRAASGDDATTTTTTMMTTTTTTASAERVGGRRGGPVTTSEVHVLVVDDERICRTVTSSLLRRCGYRVTTASSGEEALELLRRGTEFHLLLTDVMMPGVDGPALLQIVRNDERLRDMPVVMMSANEHSETVFRCIQYGAEDYLLKPVSRKAVMHMWQHVWRKSHAQTARAVPRFEDGEEVLDDEEDYRGELAHGVPAVPEHAGFTGAPPDSADDAGTNEEKASLSPPLRMIRNNSTQSVVETAASGAKVGDAGTYTRSPRDNLSQGSVIAVKRVGAAAARDEAPEPARARPLPPPLAGLEDGPRGLKEWLDDDVAGAQAVSKEERWHVGWRILAFLDDVGSRGRASYESFDANCLEISPQGAISFSAREKVSKMEDGENPFVELAQELDDHDSRFVVGLVILNMFWPEVFITVYEAEYPQEALKYVISMTGFAERAMTAEIDAAKVVASLVRRENRADVKEASERLREIAGEARSQGVETERRIETLKNLENVLETLRSARGSQLLELSHSKGMLDMLLAQAGISVAHTSGSPDGSSVRKRARVDETGGVHPSQPCDGITCYDDETLKEEGVDAVVRSAFNPARSLEPDVFGDLERQLFQKCLKATKHNTTTNDDSDASWLKRFREDGSDATLSLRTVLDDFESDVCLATRAVSIKSRAAIGGDVSDFVANNFMVCCASWDRDGEFFATAGTNKSICIYEVDAVMHMGARVHCPAVEFEAHAKVSSLCYNPYVKQSIASGDYQGVVQLWDVQKEMSTWENNTHRRRVWSIDYSRIDPTKLASASDDGTVQVYSTSTKTATCAIQNRANVCSVKFHPETAHLLAIGSADHNIHCYDLRQPSKPLTTLRGHRKAVSYVCWAGDELVSASTDNSLKLWNIKSQNSQEACVRTFSGHTNEKNFVGLSANSEGYIACGSEDNVLHVYAKSSSVPVARYSFADKTSQSNPGRRDKGGFISAVDWSPDSKHILAASSRGHLKILTLTNDA